MSWLRRSKLPRFTLAGWEILSRLVFFLATLTLFTAPVFAHDIPADVIVRAFVKPEGQTLRVLLRMPLKAVSDVEYARRDRDFVDLALVDEALREAATTALVKNISLYEGDTLLGQPNIVAAQMSLDSDTSFATYDGALAHITGPPLPVETTLLWEQGLVDVILDYPIRSDRSKFSIQAALDRLAFKVVIPLHFLPPGGVDRAYELEGGTGLVRLDPSWFQAAGRFVELGFHHILDGTDHLLFLLCLVIPFRRARTIVPIVTAFTVAHSITLIASAFNFAPDVLWFPPLIETLIALSIVYMAIENAVAPQLARRWIITFLFGLVHGFGFSFGLQHTLQFAGSHLLTSLISFNIGVELGQLLVLAVIIPVLVVLFRYVVSERVGTIILSVIVAHTAWHWMVERFEVLRQFPWPSITAEGLQWAFGIVAISAGAWLLSVVRFRKPAPLAEDTTN